MSQGAIVGRLVLRPPKARWCRKRKDPGRKKLSCGEQHPKNTIRLPRKTRKIPPEKLAAAKNTEKDPHSPSFFPPKGAAYVLFLVYSEMWCGARKRMRGGPHHGPPRLVRCDTRNSDETWACASASFHHLHFQNFGIQK